VALEPVREGLGLGVRPGREDVVHHGVDETEGVSLRAHTYTRLTSVHSTSTTLQHPALLATHRNDGFPPCNQRPCDHEEDAELHVQRLRAVADKVL
jgi:hypothetical protein